MAQPIHIGFVLFEGVTQLDFTGPYEFFSRLQGAIRYLIGKNLGPVRSDSGLCVVADTTLSTCPQLDVLCIPGGPGVNAAMEDDEILDFIRAQHKHTKFTTSVCTGSLVLGAAGLLRGINATTHWASLDLLPAFGAIVPQLPTRVVHDGKFVTGGGVTAGMDFALSLAALLADDNVAQITQLALEYDPHPPYHAGGPHTAPEAVVQAVRTRLEPVLEQRARAVARAVAKLPATQ